MKRFALLLLFVLPLALTACAGKTVLRFENETECGTATITLTNTQTGNISEHTVAQGKSIEIEMDPEIEYSYDVQYSRRCDSKTAIVALDDGQSLTVHLKNQLEEDVRSGTATPE